MTKLNVDEIKHELLGDTMTFMQLDGFMESNGYYTVLDDGDTALIAIRTCENVVYHALDTGEEEVMISFEVTKDIEDTDDRIYYEQFELRVTNVEEF